MKKGRGGKGKRMFSCWRARETLVLHVWVIGEGQLASGTAQQRGDDGNQMAVQELQGRVDDSQQLTVRFKTVNSDVRSDWRLQGCQPIF